MLDLDDLRKTAEGVLVHLHSNPLARPVFVEFSGTPKSGKSTCIDIVSHFFRRVGFNVLAPTEGASKRTPYYLRNDLVAFNTWSASYALTHILEGLHHSDKYHLAILDRGLFDALAWFQLLESNSQISNEVRETVQDFILVENWRSVIDAVFLFSADSLTAMKRENEDKLISEPGRAMNPDFLDGLNQAYQQVYSMHGGKFRNFNPIDTSDSKFTKPQSTAAQVADKILNLFPTLS
jgi:thymidylate kinase